MKILTLAAIAFAALASCTSIQKDAGPPDFTRYVNPFIGTDGPGNVYPGVSMPFGMVQLSPDNGIDGWDRIAGYYWQDSTIAGFSHTHLTGTGAGDLYDISFMPATYPYKYAEGQLGLHSKFSHAQEGAEAGYYWVRLTDYDIKVELTPTVRCGMQRYTFPEADTASVFLNLTKAMNWDKTLDSYIEVVDSMTVRGYRFSTGWARDQRIYFVSEFSKPFRSMAMDTVALTDDKGSQIGTGYTARFDYSTAADEQILVRTAISPVSMEGAQKNLRAEAGSWDFDALREAARERWNAELSKIVVETDNKDAETSFYTALYQSMLAPTVYMDVDGGYFGPDYKTHTADGFTNYSLFSLWDTYRAAHPLYTFMHPERVNDMIKSFLVFYDQHGMLPVWNFQGNETDMMIGYHSVPVIVDAYLKGIGDFDAERALAACVATANKDDYRAIGLYKKLGYIPYNLEKESVSKTLEYAYDDYSIAMMAKKMGKTEIYDQFIKRSQNYRNLYNPATSFMQPRDDKGRWIGGFDPKEYSDHITESNAWQYLWTVQQDVRGLIDIMGGPERFSQKLDSMFTYYPAADDDLPIFSTGMIGQYAHGNEPSHHVAYLYNYVGQPWKTQKYVRQIMATQYANRPDGLCGNEDCGQMSAWYVFSAMGFYPVDPVAQSYAIGSPLFDKVEMKLPDGKIFTVIAKNQSAENVYIQSATLNGTTFATDFITQEQIMAGGVLEFVMGPEPKIN